MGLTEIQIQVEDAVNNRVDEIFAVFFDMARKRHIALAHKVDCECGYCRALDDYVGKKIQRHRIKRRLEWETADEQHYLELFFEYDRKVKEAKKIKDRQKQL